ncbi:MAG: hypothetical protein WCY92_09700 [Novosphingobium sp.]
MMEAATTELADDSVEFALREELARGDELIVSAKQVLRHLLANHDRSIFSDAVLARIRGMLSHVESQLLTFLAEKSGVEDRGNFVEQRSGPLKVALASNAVALTHAHSLAIEWQLAERLQRSGGLDPVLSPMLQRLVASDDADTAEIAMGFLTSQARFVQQQRRMELPLTELPGDLLHGVLQAWSAVVSEADAEAVTAVERDLRNAFDEGRSRLGLMARLVTGFKEGAASGLNISDSGVALFLTSMALASGQDRRLVALSTHEDQLARLLLSLRSAGLEREAVFALLAVLHPEIAIPDGMEIVGPDRAAELLSDSSIALAEA